MAGRNTTAFPNSTHSAEVVFTALDFTVRKNVPFHGTVVFMHVYLG
jgi:hypothetical protein